jgi:hypothetical protein
MRRKEGGREGRNYYKFRALKQHSYIIFQSPETESRYSTVGPSAQCLPRLQSRCQPGLFQAYGTMGIALFLVSAGLRPLASYWLLTRSHPQVLESPK